MAEWGDTLTLAQSDSDLKYVLGDAVRIVQALSFDDGLGVLSPQFRRTQKCVENALECHSYFAEKKFRYFGAKNLNLTLTPQMQARNLLLYAKNHGISDSIGWLHRVYETKTADIVFYGATYGIRVSEVVSLLDDITLLPLNLKQDSNIAQGILKKHIVQEPGGIKGGFHAPILIQLKIVNATATDLDNNGERPKETNSAVENAEKRCADIIDGLTLIQHAAPVMAIKWFEFSDSDLKYAETSSRWEEPLFEGNITYNIVEFDKDKISLIK